ncbi:Signal peptide peptidase-like 2A [Labeo rohita]|uniref:Signal peptide peptidase-like 2A n=1 Tax=Labeo rohita TaxID=84645 RepID=A0ABQ8LBH5_LABRO|nr:Signal peptide peptidase-like 2A [Labeo rohita]
MAVNVLSFLVLLWFCAQVDGQEAILHVSNGSTVREYCLVFNSSWSSISDSLSGAVAYPLVNLTSSQLCVRGQQASLKGRAVVVSRGGCDFSQKALVAQNLNASVLLIATTDSLVTPSANESEYSKVRLYAPPVPPFDASIVVMLLIAVFTVTMGGFWSGAVEKLKQAAGPASDAGEGQSDSNELSLYSPLKVLLFVAMMCVMLVLMYFFYRWLGESRCRTTFRKCGGAVSCSGKSVSIRSLLLAAVCITLSVIWGVYRNEDRWIWILQDLLGVAFCLNFLKTISLSNFKICVILLSLLLLYDVFFVFITPFLTKNGESIMVQVALGPGAGGKGDGIGVEIPGENSSTYEKFSALAQNLCMMQFSILGYGDIIIPGLLVAYCHKFDVWMGNSRRIYFISCAVAYAVGLGVTFAVMLLSKMGQPALLYLVPCTLLTSGILASVRKEFRHFWSGTGTYQVSRVTDGRIPSASVCSVSLQTSSGLM